MLLLLDDVVDAVVRRGRSSEEEVTAAGTAMRVVSSVDIFIALRWLFFVMDITTVYKREREML